MGRPARSTAATRPYRWWRWAILASVIGGILGMHVLTGGDMAGGHGPLPTAAHATHTFQGAMPGTHEHSAGPRARETATPESDPGAFRAGLADGGMDHRGMATCILFLGAAGAALLAALSAARGTRAGHRTAGPVGASAREVMRRGPPGAKPPRLALCVYRI